MKHATPVLAMTLSFCALISSSATKSLGRVQQPLEGREVLIDLTTPSTPRRRCGRGLANDAVQAVDAGRTFEGFAKEGDEFSYGTHGFVATAYELTTDQYGTQLRPAGALQSAGRNHQRLPPTYAVRPLVVINIADKVVKDVNYHMTVTTSRSGRSGTAASRKASVVMVRSDCTKSGTIRSAFRAARTPACNRSDRSCICSARFSSTATNHWTPTPRPTSPAKPGF